MLCAFSCIPGCVVLSEGLGRADGKAAPKLKPDVPLTVLLVALNPPKVEAVAGAAVVGAVVEAVSPVVVGFPNVKPLVPNPAAAVAPTAGNDETAGAGVGVLFSPPGADVWAVPCCPKAPKLKVGCVVVMFPVVPLLEDAVFPN